MPGFTDAITALKTQLQTDAALAAFCAAAWGKGLTVQVAYKRRVEIHESDLPLILITRPDMKKKYLTGVRDGIHRARLYCGFLKADREQAQLDLIGFEEAIDDAILADYTLGGTVIKAIPTESANDEGEHRPVYFMVMDVEIHHRRAGI